MTERQVLELASRQYGPISSLQAHVSKHSISASTTMLRGGGCRRDGGSGTPPACTACLGGRSRGDGRCGPRISTPARRRRSHESAAALHELTSFRPGPLTLTVAHGAHQRPGEATVHQSRDLATVHCVRIDGFPVTTVERTLIDLAATTRRARLALALDDACLTRRCRLQDVRALYEELRRPGKPGTRRLGLLLAARGPGYVPPDSVLERRLLRVLSRGGIPATRAAGGVPLAPVVPEQGRWPVSVRAGHRRV